MAMANHITLKSMATAYLSHPLVLDLCDLGVRITHHGDQEVDQQDEDDRQEEEAEQLKNERGLRLLLLVYLPLSWRSGAQQES